MIQTTVLKKNPTKKLKKPAAVNMVKMLPPFTIHQCHYSNGKNGWSHEDNACSARQLRILGVIANVL